MGFLTGTYFKIAATRMKLQIEHQMLSIQSQLNRVTRQIGVVERNLSSQQRSMQYALRNQMQQSLFTVARDKGIDMNNLMGADPTKMQAFSLVQQQMQYQMANAQSVWEQRFEDIRQAQLEPLKDLEMDLQSRMKQLETRKAIYEAQEKTGEQMSQSGLKDLTPGQG